MPLDPEETLAFAALIDFIEPPSAAESKEVRRLELMLQIKCFIIQYEYTRFFFGRFLVYKCVCVAEIREQRLSSRAGEISIDYNYREHKSDHY